MGIRTVVGLVIAAVVILCGMALWGGGTPLWHAGSLLFVIGATAGAMFVSFPAKNVLKIGSVVGLALRSHPVDPADTVRELVHLSEVARREGMLALERGNESRWHLLSRGIRLAVDGADSDLIKSVLETEVEAASRRHARAREMVEAAGRFAPAMGVLGMLAGLGFILRDLSQPEALGPGVSVAIATALYGLLVSSLAAGPMTQRLRLLDAEEVARGEIAIAGVLSIQAGESPRVVESRLLSFLSPGARVAPEAHRMKLAA